MTAKLFTLLTILGDTYYMFSRIFRPFARFVQPTYVISKSKSNSEVFVLIFVERICYRKQQNDKSH